MTIREKDDYRRDALRLWHSVMDDIDYTPEAVEIIARPHIEKVIADIERRERAQNLP